MAGVVTNKDLCFLGKLPAWSPTETLSVIFRQMASVVTDRYIECVFLSKWPAWSLTKT
jgi:hypothetical protein